MVENAELAKGKRGEKIKERNLFSSYRVADVEVNSEQANSLLNTAHVLG